MKIHSLLMLTRLVFWA